MLTDDEFAKHMRALRGLPGPIGWELEDDSYVEGFCGLWERLRDRYEKKIPPPTDAYLYGRGELDVPHKNYGLGRGELPYCAFSTAVLIWRPKGGTGSYEFIKLVVEVSKGSFFLSWDPYLENEAIRRINAYRR